MRVPLLGSALEGDPLRHVIMLLSLRRVKRAKGGGHQSPCLPLLNHTSCLNGPEPMSGPVQPSYTDSSLWSRPLCTPRSDEWPKGYWFPSGEGLGWILNLQAGCPNTCTVWDRGKVEREGAGHRSGLHLQSC